VRLCVSVWSVQWVLYVCTMYEAGGGNEVDAGRQAGTQQAAGSRAGGYRAGAEALSQ